ncbi:protein Jade-3 isoform X4 [Sceloporus undulatus]|uniref:protein Jade-3 isoform X4 n=1 Tax=Sceloporus undulatus TaxID=8520 RepID=UPI001C4ABFEA|nr:protein Jade-3 isoform X4 [Sceloporus undulatus]
MQVTGQRFMARWGLQSESSKSLFPLSQEHVAYLRQNLVVVGGHKNTRDLELTGKVLPFQLFCSVEKESLQKLPRCVRMKRHRHLSSSDSSDNESPSTSFSFCSKYRSKSKTPANEQKKPAEVFRKDLISAMKLPDSHHINPDEYYLFTDTWKQEWEKGVQVPASPDTIPQPSLRVVAEKVKQVLYTRPRKYIRCSSQESSEPGYINILELAESMCRYDLDDMDIFWLQEVNEELAEMGCGQLDENTMEKMVEVLERHCHENMNHAIETEEGLGIEYDEDVICDVCRSPDSEEGNDMVFCDKCNICVHQACYGILKVPEGSWLCRTCVLGIHPQCLLCPKRGGAMKATRTGTKWAHVSCALWIPEVSIACPERMEPITKVSHIPPSRWALVCSLCKLKTGACIQVRNLCYMVSRREKLKLSHSKAHEQVFNLQVQLINQEIAAGHSLTTALENTLFYPPPRITLKLKMPKSTLGDSKNNLKSGNKLLSPDNNATFCSRKGVALSKETFSSNVKSYSKFQHENRSNGLLGGIVKSRNETKDSRPAHSIDLHRGQSSGKPLALQAALHGQSAIGNGKIQQNSKQVKSNGLMSRVGDVIQRDSSSQTTYEQQSVHLSSQSSFKKSTIEHFSRSFKEATNSLVRTTEDLRCCEKPSRRFSLRERSWGKQTLEYQMGSAPYQDNDGYCPDLELSDSEAEGDGNKGQIRLRKSGSEQASPSKDFSRDCHNRNKRNLISHSSIQS